MHIGTAGWSLPREMAGEFPGDGHQLQRYAQRLGCVEINSSFYRPHRRATYERWAALTPPGFRFAVKLPKSISHEGRLQGMDEPLRRFLDEAAGLGDRLAVILVQLPPSFAFELRPVRYFFDLLGGQFGGAVVCEPRHASWFAPAAERALAAARVSRVAADPSRWPEGQQPGGWLGPEGDGRGAVLYHRWHGSPRRYWSCYEPGWLAERAAAWQRWHADAERWTIFDNTAGGAALPNALEFQRLLEDAGIG